MTTDTTAALTKSASALIRNEPVQARSAARLTALLDSTAAVIHSIGYERLTTAMVAERAGASIGTVYRYFPDRIAVLQALGLRNLETLVDNCTAAISGSRTREAAIETIFEELVGAFRSIVGFPSVRFGDVLDLRPAEGETKLAEFVDELVPVIDRATGSETSATQRESLLLAVTIMDAGLALAFRNHDDGDPKQLERVRAAARAALAD